MYFPLNEVAVALDTTGSLSGALRLSLATETPSFDGFDVRIGRADDAGTDSFVTTTHEGYWNWRLPDAGSAGLTIRAKNMAGRYGRPSRFTVTATRLAEAQAHIVTVP